MADDEGTVPGMAEAVEHRRLALGLSPTGLEQASGLSSPICLEVRAGRRKRYAFKTLRGIAHALRWPADWYERIVVGEDPTAFEDTDWARPATDPGDSMDFNSRVARLPEADQKTLKDLIDRFERDLEGGR